MHRCLGGCGNGVNHRPYCWRCWRCLSPCGQGLLARAYGTPLWGLSVAAARCYLARHRPRLERYEAWEEAAVARLRRRADLRACDLGGEG